MKKIILLLLLVFFKVSFAQKELITNTGVINFEASVPLFEEVTATNKNASCILNIKNGALKSSVTMKEFRFKLALMEEHFNEKYIESERYPTATFKGTIEGFNLYIIGNSHKKFMMNGELKIHGKSKKIRTPVLLQKTENGLEIVADFNVKPSDFNIKIPEILSVKVAETVNINTQFVLN